MKIKRINNSLLQTATLFAVALVLFSAQGISAQSITGPPNVAVGDEEGYTLSGASATSWVVPAGTQIVSQTSSTVVVRFNTAGSSFVRALHNVGQGFTVLNVTVTGGPPPTPNNPTVLSNACGSSTLQRTSNPGTGISWFWQGTDAFGTNMSASNNAVNNNYVANQGSDRYYIRARQNGQWSANSGFVDVTITETPTEPTANIVPPSCGGVVTLSVSNPNSAYDYRWYNASGSSWIGTGTSFTTDPLTSSTDFLVRAVTKSPNPICVSPATTVSVTVNSPPKPAGNQTVTSTCNSPDIELTASNTTYPDNSTAIEHRWYFSENASGSGSYFVGTPLLGAGFRTKIVVSGITQDTTYWVAAVVNGCESERHPITADYEENIEPTLDVINITGPQCGPSANFTLNATVVGGNGSFTWHDAQTGGNEVATGNQYIATVSTVGTTSFWVGGTLTNALGCDYTISPRQEVQVVLTQLPDPPTVNTVPPSCGGVVTLSVNSPNSAYDYRWYNASGSSLIGTGTSFTTDPLTASTDFLVRAVTKSPNPICVSTGTTVSVTVSSPPKPAGNQTVTSTCSSPDIELIASNTTYPNGSTEIEHRWYFTAGGTGAGSYILGTPIPGAGFRTKIDVSGITQDTTYWVAAVVNGCEGESERHAITADYEENIEPTLDLINITGPQCGPTANFTLNATVIGGNGNFTWYDAPTGGNEVSTDNQYIAAVSTVGTTSFWVGGTLTNVLGCDYTISPRQEVQVVLNQLPDFPAVSNDGNCVNTEVTFTASGGATGATYNWYEANDTFIESGATFTTPTLASTTDYKVSATLNGCEGPKLTISAVIGTVPGVAGGGSVSRCGPGTVTLTATLGTNASDIRWFDALTGGNEVGTGTEFTTPSISTSTYYYAESAAGTCAATTRHPIEAIILDQTTYYEDADNDSLGDPASSVQDCTPPNGYVENSNDQCPTIFSPINDCSAPSGDPSDWNYVYSRTYQTAETAPTSPFFDPNDNLIQDITYFDGLGRPIQQNGIDQSPLKNDIIVHTEYDGFGRAEKEYLPYATTDTNPQGSYRLNALTPTEDHYNVVKYQNTPNPYSQKKFEDSPLSRVLKQAAPGAAWAMDTGHEIAFDYSSNNTSNDNVKRFNVTLNLADLAYTPTLVANGNYAAGELMKMVTKDENHDTADGKLHTTEEFTDKQRRVILKRTYALVGGSQEAHDTYYVYDDFGNLSYVLPPKMEGGTAHLNELGYQYIYDNRNRLVEKRIPGKGKEYIIYNKLDQPIMTQDANQRLIDEWLFTKYDAFGRVAYTGKATDARGRTVVQNDVNAVSGALWVIKGGAQSYGGTTVYYNNGAYPSATSPITTLDEILTINYYDDYNFDRAGAPLTTTLLGSSPAVSSASNVKGLATGSKVKVLDDSASSAQAWITTVTLYDEKTRPIYSFANNSYLGTVDIVQMQLDFTGRTLKSRTAHTRNSNTIVTIDNFTYDHVGRLLAQTQCIGDETMGTSCNTSGAGGADADPVLNGTISTDQVATNSITIEADATIVPTTTLRIDPNAGGPANAELIALNTYDELGRLDSKKVGGGVNTGNVMNALGLQTVDYNYNIRDWLTGINDENKNDNDLSIDANDLFAFKIDYENPVAGGTPLYNGNISKTLWRTNNDSPSLRSYTYSYDALNRITSGIDNTNDDRYSLLGVTYDKNGNILTLSRKGHTSLDANDMVTGYGDMDVLSYSYENNQMSNKLASVTDGISGSAGDGGFKDGNTTGDDYDYDANGNMIQDLNKGITASGITYNYLNLPEQVNISGGSISYIYDATGIKLKKTVSTGTVTDYAGNYIYENNVLQFMSHPEGYAEPISSNWDYVYQYKDHLGNVRLSYKDISSNSTPSLEIQEENNYYPFGLKHKGYNSVVNSTNVGQNFKYNGKEIDKDLGLNLYHYGFRLYDPAIGRFPSIDPIADRFPHVSTYNYAENEPVGSIDLYGLQRVKANGKNFEKKKAFSSFTPNYKPQGQIFSYSGSLRRTFGPSLKGGLSFGRKSKATLDLSIVETSATVTNKDGVTIKGKGKIINASGGFVSPFGDSQLDFSAGEVSASMNEHDGFELDASLIKGTAFGKTKRGTSISDGFVLFSSNPEDNASFTGLKGKQEINTKAGTFNAILDGDSFGFGFAAGPGSVSVAADKENASNAISNWFNNLVDLLVNGPKTSPSEQEMNNSNN